MYHVLLFEHFHLRTSGHVEDKASLQSFGPNY